MTLERYLNTATLLFFLPFNVFGWMDIHSAEITVCGRVVACNSGPKTESAKFY